MAFPNCTIEAPVDFASSRADTLFSNLQKSISAECGNWSKNKRKRNARRAVDLGMVNDVQEFCRMFPVVKTSKTTRVSQQETEKSKTLKEWKQWCEEHCVEGEVDMNLLKIIYNGKVRRKQAKIKKQQQMRLAAQSKSCVKDPPVEPKCRQRQYGVYSQITRKEWGSAYRPAHG